MEQENGITSQTGLILYFSPLTPLPPQHDPQPSSAYWVTHPTLCALHVPSLVPIIHAGLEGHIAWANSPEMSLALFLML